MSVTPSLDDDTGATKFTVSANSSTTKAGSDYITVTSETLPLDKNDPNSATNTTYTIDLAPTTKQAIDRNATAINGLSDRIDDMEDDLRAGIAGANALAFLQRPNEAGKSMVSAAVGGFRDQQALAIGYARNSDNNKWSIKAGVGVNTQKDVNWGGSVGYQW
ncbi:MULTISPECIES: YadA-like family protein [Neisseria]|uniref:YadA C-terminal domain-containing protein n=1 Tax=Neisseria TaxID=482 RepID=UPI001E480F39|nr:MULTISPECIES: YadA-like family protein [Neisseria]